MRSSFSFSLLFCALGAFAQPPAGYYDPAAGLSGEPLRAALRDIINGHTVLSNSQLWSAFGQTDRKPNTKVWDIYSDVPGGTPPYEYTFVTDQCGSYDEEGDCFNREHSFPQSWFGGMPGPDTDLFHIYPTDGWVNQKRANWPYGMVGGSTTFLADNGGKLGQCTYPGCSGLVFEPIDEYKGDLARGHFYLLTRYMNEADNWADAPILSAGAFLPWVENLLLEWHAQDPVSPKEVARNNAIFNSLQHNRNPFIDHPEWVSSIWGPLASVEESNIRPATVRIDGDLLRIDRPEAMGTARISVFTTTGSQVHTYSTTDRSSSVVMNGAHGLYLVLVEDQVRTVIRVAY